MKKLILVLAIVLGTVGVIRVVQLKRAERWDAVLNHVINCSEVYEKALQYVDDTTIVNVLKDIKNKQPDEYFCVELPYGYKALPKDPFKVDGGEIVTVVDSEPCYGFEKHMEVMFKRNGEIFWLDVNNNGPIEKQRYSFHDYFDVWRIYRAIIINDLNYGCSAK